ncbi:sugar phosphate isomerase/epimerase [Egibacter rhizosphaerae]|uniref:Sugar phosphate isomerase/epimerase n=1 Tax=Egibacter rhizosphaerae TaxID=1670831 RepID=A0A411YGR9_9ACTN|nr:sugar phosphate isomerase/epimerase family protein [Egibacter rhizosphaerae]QBI20505.1 sugar phosphate isomerase/epimerase [Egibacter rhizosphaerae]
MAEPSAPGGGGAWLLAYTVTTPDCAASSSMGYRAPLDEAAPRLAELGYDGVEAWVRDAREVDREALQRTLDRSRLRLAAVGTGPIAAEDGLTLADVAVPERREEAIARIEAAIELAAEHDALVTIGRVRGSPGVEEPERRRAVVEALDRIDAAAARAGVRVVLEPQSRLVGPYLRTVAEVVEVIDDAGWQRIGVMPDTFHMGLEERSMVAGLLAAGTRLWHVQLGDTDRSPLGLGALDTGLVADALDGVGYRGWLTMEHDQRGDSFDAARRSARAAAAMRDRVGR